MRLLLLLYGLFFGFLGNAQDTTTTYNPKLAKELGADDYGMKNYIFVLLKSGSTEMTDQDSLNIIYRGHFDNMEVMARNGKLALSGPFGKNEKGYRGLFILDVASKTEALELLQKDPAIAAGIFDVELTPWYGSAALPVFIETHNKIAKLKP